MKIINKKTISITIITFIAIAITVFTENFIKQTNFNNYSMILYNTGALFGLIGYLALTLLIISGDLARYFDKYFGIDSIIKTQRKFSIITTIFVITHPILFILSNTYWANYLIPQFKIIPLAMGTIALYLFLLILLSSFLYKKISQTTWQYLHLMIYALFFISSFHAINQGTSYNNNLLIQIIFTIILILFITGLIYRTQYKLRKYFEEKPKTLNIRKETQDTFTIVITKPENFKYEAGQFAFLKLDKNKLYARHPFTISSAPHQKEIDFTIKNTGKFTNIAKKLKQGEKINIEGPYGTFVANNEDDLILVAGGVGITPFLSIIKDKTHKKTKQKITLIYCTKTQKDIIRKKELDKLQKQNKNLKIIHYISQENTKKENKNKNNKEYEGRLNKENFLKYLKIRKQENTILMMCGPEPLKKTIKQIIKKEKIKIKTKQESFFW